MVGQTSEHPQAIQSWQIDIKQQQRQLASSGVMLGAVDVIPPGS